MTQELIFLEPVFHQKIWGGRMLESDFGYQIPDGPIGECWAISAHQSGDCKVAKGRFAGMHLSELWSTHRELFGKLASDQFPLLIKILAADDDLSIQVHPDDTYAAQHENGSLGKCECWYVLHAKPGATIVVGQNASSREEFARAVNKSKWGELLNIIPVKTGDFFQINPGTVHAIRGGTLILETQQSSDVTYRVYDYNRRQADGSLRELHLQQSLDVIDYKQQAPTNGTITAIEKNGVTRLVSCDCYTVDRVRVEDTTRLMAHWPFLCMSVIEGSGKVNGQLVARGDHFIAPAGIDVLELTGSMELICSYPPAD
ncbi:type I phosphomannose isomerase catalytic subunit [Atopobium fossor]|uniref:type I phosphomannose isomerase catalytic subunit n=1 Tax=Atopobium fossor TaxID=39487 RepID=UPI00041D0CE7|nr:type I phosphomannose isomerase catalytic subunit [Atopobium fossor]